jgi:hypothetical protein
MRSSHEFYKCHPPFRLLEKDREKKITNKNRKREKSKQTSKERKEIN